jgi:hypothetical protein
MLRLPLPSEEITALCSLTIGTALMNVVSGISVTLFDPSNERGQAGRKFKRVLEAFYPWDTEPGWGTVSPAAEEVIYDLFRNPLAHALGFQHPGPGGHIVVNRIPEGAARGFSEQQLEELETAVQRPTGILEMVRRGVRWDIPTLHHEPPKTALFIEPFYWGVRELIRRLTTDKARMAKAEAFLTPIMRGR